MKKIMFICTGNICRSAMAHKMLEKIAEEENLDIKVYSAGYMQKMVIHLPIMQLKQWKNMG